MADKQAATRAGFRTILKEASARVARMPYWKRNLAPCADDQCEGGYEHAGNHWRTKPAEYDEW